MTDKKLTKEQAQALYDNMHRAMQAKMGASGATIAHPAQSISAKKKPQQQSGLKAATAAAKQVVGSASYAKTALNSERTPPAALSRLAIKSRVVSRLTNRTNWSGQGLALAVLAFLACAKVTLAVIEVSGAARVEEASAALARIPSGPRWTKEEAKILTALDTRRVELEERGARLEKREGEFAEKERELAVRLTELKDISEKLKIDREKGDKQRSTQLDQLANVYGSMNPPEAAHLLEQLDIQVALSLVERMPEKRMAQILSLMNAQRALELTNLLTHRS
jgi:flagellar motility protein MotE (MotC chaperone)